MSSTSIARERSRPALLPKQARRQSAFTSFQSFMFGFAGQRWDSFFVSRQGLVTFGEPLSYSYDDSENGGRQAEAGTGIRQEGRTSMMLTRAVEPISMTVCSPPSRRVA